MTAQILARIAAVKMPAASLREVLAILAEYSPPSDPVMESRRERDRERKRASRAEMSADKAGQSADSPRTNADGPSPPSPLPLHPLSPAPTPELPPAPACVKPEPEKRSDSKPKSGSKRQLLEAACREANAEPLPLDLRADGFPEIWREWCDHRTDLCRRDTRKVWTPRAAKNTLLECARHGSALAVMAIRAALSNGWQGLVWDRLQPASNNGKSHRSTHAPSNFAAFQRPGEPAAAPKTGRIL